MRREESMFSKTQIELSVCSAYRAFIKEQDSTAETRELLLILSIYRHMLIERNKRQKLGNFRWLLTLKHGIRRAEIFFDQVVTDYPSKMAGWFAGCEAYNDQQELASLLCDLIMELSIEVSAIEAKFSEMNPAFDRERAAYRKMKEEVDGALLIH
jgi:hypothetical protein